MGTVSRMVRILGPLAALALLVGLGASAPVTAARSAEPRSAAVPSAVIVAAGDIACRPQAYVTPSRCRHAATAQAAVSLKPDRVLALGDLQYEIGNFDAFRSVYGETWGVLKPKTWPVVGNHEYRTPGARGYYRYFSNATTAPGYYRREINGWQVFVLNSNCDQVDCLAERNWLRNRLIANPSRCALIAMHHPRFSSGLEHGSTAAMRPFWAVAQRHGVDLALSGHDHDYERFRVQDTTGHADPEGIQQIVVGTGGKSLYPKGAPAPGSVKFLNGYFGVLKLTLRPAGWSWQFRDTGLTLRDSGSLACR